MSLGKAGRLPVKARACWGLPWALALASCPNILAEAADELSRACSFWKASPALALSPEEHHATGFGSFSGVGRQLIAS